MADPDVAFTRLDRDIEERFQSLRRALDVHAFGMNLIVLQPGQRGRIHAHEHQEEVYLVIEGELTLLVEGAKHVLGADTLVRVGPDVRRQLVNAGGSRLVLLALGGSGEHVGRDAHAWISWDEQGSGLSPQEVPLPQDLPGGGEVEHPATLGFDQTDEGSASGAT
jgi:mannose-6-phosphate isomerase-like protein (cupin superfamily)